MTWLNRIEQIEEFEDAEFDAALVAEMECEAAYGKFQEIEYELCEAGRSSAGRNRSKRQGLQPLRNDGAAQAG